MDLSYLKKTILKTIRGRRSQLQLSRRLGYSFNKVYRWESGQNRILWQEFISLCRACKINIDQILLDAFSFDQDCTRSEFLVLHLIGNQNIVSLAKLTGISRFSLSDWSRGKSDPTLDQILLLLEQKNLLLPFLEQIPGLESDFPVSKKIASKKLALKFFNENPLAGAALVAFDLTQYQKAKFHIPGFIAKKVGIALDEEAEMIMKMERVGLIRFENGKYVKNDLNFNTRGDIQSDKKIREFWVQKGLKVDFNRTRVSPNNHFGYLIFAADRKKKKRIFEVYQQFISSLSTIVNTESEKDDQLMVMTLQFFGVDEIFE